MATTIRQPEISLSLASADLLVGLKEQKILVVGQKTATGSAPTGVLVTNIQNDNSQDTLFGADSQLSGMIRNIRRYNIETQVDVIPLDDNGAGVAATGEFPISGTATEDGVLTFIIGSKVDYSFQVPVTSGDNAAAIIASAIAIIGASSSLPVSVADGTTKIDVTAKNDGTVGNDIGLKVEGSVAGVTATTTAMSGGSVDPVFTGIFDQISDIRYQTIVWPYSADTDTVKNFLDARFNVNNKVLDGVAIVSSDDTYGNLIALGDGENSQSLVIIGDELVNDSDYRGGSILELPYAKAAQVGAIRALRLTEDANISRFVISRNAALDRFGGMAIASLPYFNTPVPELPLQSVIDGFTDQEIEDLLDSGISVLGNNIADNEILFGEMVTTYKTDAASNEDITFKFLNYVDTSSVIREYYFNNLKARFNQHRLTEGALIPGRAMANAASIEAFCTRLYGELASQALVQDGEAAFQFYKENLLIDIDLSTGKVTITMKMPIVTQLRQIIGTIQIAFTTEA